MAWKYVQRTGDLFLNALYVETGYAGRGRGKNNPNEQCVTDEGPIPRGWWTIGSATNGGPTRISLPLTADSGADVCGRSGFFVHGDSILNPGSASHGCIILSKATRERMASSNDPRLRVVSDSSTPIRRRYKKLRRTKIRLR